MANVAPLSDDEVSQFVGELDENKDGFISYSELELKLEQVHEEIAPEAHSHNLHHESRDEQDRHHFLRHMLRTDAAQISTEDFANTVRGWNVPSLKQVRKIEDEATAYLRSFSAWRRVRAYWAVEGPEYVFMGFVVGLMIAFGVWQMVKYITTPKYRAALGWGVVLSKTNAGILYPTWFFLIISMSRYLAALMRRSYTLSRFVNWDLSETFHVRISILALVFSSFHAIGHLTGTFVHGSQRANQGSVAALLGPDAIPKSYVDYVRTLPGWTGLTALGMFYVLGLLSLPAVRKWRYEIFQLGHLLMFPIFGLLAAHGVLQLLQFAMLGYWLVIPVLLVTFERVMRVANGFRRIPAQFRVLDADTVQIIATIPAHRVAPYKAGEWVMLQIPAISFFQWHPFTISTCFGNELQLHIKTDGNWTSQLQKLARESQSGTIYIGLDGPFGAPAQGFYDFEQVIFVGAGIGVTPFSGILLDLQKREDDKWQSTTSGAEKPAPVLGKSDQAHQTQIDEIKTAPPTSKPGSGYRRIDFHWIVRDRNYLLWFSELLNRISSGDHNPQLDIRIQTHVTKKRGNISTHVFRYLLEQHRTEAHPASPLTGLINPTHFGRPDLETILNDHYHDMKLLFSGEAQQGKKRRVGVFFCGAPVIGHELADRCRLLTLRGREDRSMIEYHFMMEVF